MNKNNFGFIKKIVVNFLNQLAFSNVEAMNIKVKINAVSKTMDSLHVLIDGEHAIDIEVGFERHDAATNYKKVKKIKVLNMRLLYDFIQGHVCIHEGVTKEYISSIFVEKLNWVNIQLRLDYKIVYCLMAKHKDWRNDVKHIIYCFMDKDNKPYDVYGYDGVKDQERLKFCSEKIDKMAIMYLFYKNYEEHYNDTFPPFTHDLNINAIDDLDNKLALVSMMQY